MAFIDFLTGLAASLLKFAAWILATLLGLTVISLGLAGLLAWLLVNRLLGRKPTVTLGGRFRDWRQFRAGFGASGFQTGAFWPRPRPAEDATSEAPQRPRRLARPGEVEDVQARDLPPDRTRP